MHQYGGYLQAQYWFTNEWFLKPLGLHPGLRHQQEHLRLPWQGPARPPNGYIYASNNDQTKFWSEYDLTLWYRPVDALKFGLQYGFERTYLLQNLNTPTVATAPVAAA